MLLLRLFVLTALVMAMPQPAVAKVWRHDNPLVDQETVEFRADSATVRLEPKSRKVTEEGETFDIGIVRATIQFDGAEPVEVALDEAVIATHGVWSGIGRLDRSDVDPAIILAGYTGGMHCCVTFQLVTRHRGEVRVLSLPMMDGDPDSGFPRDIDGDGVADFQRADDSFLYAFTSYAGSWPPPRLWNLRDGAMVDVSAEPRFAKFWQREARKVGKHCRKGQVGACAAYAAAMARLGQADRGIAEAIRHAPKADWLPEPCTVDYVNDECPEGKTRVFSGFEEGLRWLLSERGYLREPLLPGGAGER